MTSRLLDPALHASGALLRAQSDRRLVELTRMGNERAFEVIVQRYQRPLVRYCTRLLPQARAEDAVQQAFVNAYDAMRRDDADLELRPWLFRIARNAALNVLRESGWSHEQLDEQIDGVERPPEAFERRERLRQLVGSVQRLPPRQRGAIVLREFEGRSYEEIATALALSDGAVRQLLNRARSTLRAGVTALTPPGLLARVASGGDVSAVAGRVAESGAAAGGLAAVAKLSVGLIAGGALIAGGSHLLPQALERHHHRAPPAALDAAHAARATAAGAPAAAHEARSSRAGRTREPAPGASSPAARAPSSSPLADIASGRLLLSHGGGRPGTTFAAAPGGDASRHDGSTATGSGSDGSRGGGGDGGMRSDGSASGSHDGGSSGGSRDGGSGSSTSGGGSGSSTSGGGSGPDGGSSGDGGMRTSTTSTTQGSSDGGSSDGGGSGTSGR